MHCEKILNNRRYDLRFCEDSVIAFDKLNDDCLICVGAWDIFLGGGMATLY